MGILLTFSLLSTLVSPISAREIQFGTIDYCPLVCKESQKLPGIMIEVTKEIFKDSKYRPNLNFMSLKRATIESLNSGLDGFILGSKVHFKKNYFPKKPTLSQPIFFFTSVDSKWKYTNINSLKNISVAAIENFNYMNEEVNKFLKTSKNVTWLNEEGAHKRAFELLQRKRVHAFIGGSFSTYYMAKIHGFSKKIKASSEPIGHYDNYISISSKVPKKDRFQILNLIDKQTEELQNSGKLEKIYSKYRIK